jgi:hypothetical protein
MNAVNKLLSISKKKECRWCQRKVSKRIISLKKYGDFCSEKCARAYIEWHFCDYENCTNEPFAEVYHIKKTKGWSYLCRKHFRQEKEQIRKSGGFWCEAG